MSKEVLDVIKNSLGYTDEEMELWLENPRNQEALLKVPALLQKTIIIEVVESHGCSSLHKVGDKFYFDGPGGGFIVSAANMHPAVKVQNLRWMVKATKEFGKYPLSF
ncbi:MAG: hypothetical protein ACFFC1_01185 [Promethearchaeota archaeon]